MTGIPSEFCLRRTIARQHIQIEALVGALKNRLASRSIATRNLVSLLNSLAVHLEIHFELEEQEEYFSHVLNKAPRLSEQIDILRKEHVSLHKEIAELVELARFAFSSENDTAELARRFRLFQEKLLKHEQTEIDLLQEAFAPDIESGE